MIRDMPSRVPGGGGARHQAGNRSPRDVASFSAMPPSTEPGSSSVVSAQVRPPAVPTPGPPTPPVRIAVADHAPTLSRLGPLLKAGSLEIRAPDGTRRVVRGAANGPAAEIVVH